jgi:hypothetical protein
MTTLETPSSVEKETKIDLPGTTDDFETTALLPRRTQVITNPTPVIRRLFLYLERTIRIAFVF